MTLSAITAYYRPSDLASALTLLREGRGRVVPLAGGTALLAAPSRDVEGVVDLRDLKLDWARAGADGSLALGAMATLGELVAGEAAQGYAGGILAEAARYAAGSLVRARATLGGTLVARAARSEVAAALLALDASVVVADGREQVVPLLDLFHRRDALLRPGALLTELRLPAPAPGSRASLHRVARTPMDQPLLAVAALVRREGSRIVAARVAATALGGAPALLVALGNEVQGTEIGSDRFERAIARAAEGLAIRGDHLATAAYRAAMLPVLVRRALTTDTSE